MTTKYRKRLFVSLALLIAVGATAPARGRVANLALLIFRPESSLVYFNIDHVCATILGRVGAQRTRPRLVILDLSAALRVDLQSAHALGDLADDLNAKRVHQAG